MPRQITPVTLSDAIIDPDPAAAKRPFDAMMKMTTIDIVAIEAAQKGWIAMRTTKSGTTRPRKRAEA